MENNRKLEELLKKEREKNIALDKWWENKVVLEKARLMHKVRAILDFNLNQIQLCLAEESGVQQSPAIKMALSRVRTIMERIKDLDRSL